MPVLFVAQGLCWTNHLPQLFGQLVILAVIHRTIDNAHRVIRQRLSQYGQQVGGARHAIAFGTEGFRIFYEIGIIEVNIRDPAKGIHLFPLDQAVGVIAPDQDYNWEVDVMADEWNASKADKKIKTIPEEKVCDILLNQDVFSGVGNIIKNEVLFLTRIHPESLIGALLLKK